jgi:hypothetical protein
MAPGFRYAPPSDHGTWSNITSGTTNGGGSPGSQEIPKIVALVALPLITAALRKSRAAEMRPLGSFALGAL